MRTEEILEDWAAIDIYWNMDGGKSLSEPWIGVTRLALLNKKPPEGKMSVQRRLTKKLVSNNKTREHVNSTPYRAHLSRVTHAIFLVVCTWLKIVGL